MALCKLSLHNKNYYALFYNIYYLQCLFLEKKTLESLREGPNNSVGDGFSRPKSSKPVSKIMGM